MLPPSQFRVCSPGHLANRETMIRRDASASGLRFDITQLTLRQCSEWAAMAIQRGLARIDVVTDSGTYRLRALAEVP